MGYHFLHVYTFCLSNGQRVIHCINVHWFVWFMPACRHSIFACNIFCTCIAYKNTRTNGPMLVKWYERSDLLIITSAPMNRIKCTIKDNDMRVTCSLWHASKNLQLKTEVFNPELLIIHTFCTESTIIYIFSIIIPLNCYKIEKLGNFHVKWRLHFSFTVIPFSKNIIRNLI